MNSAIDYPRRTWWCGSLSTLHRKGSAVICNDPYVRLLADFGYATVRLPRETLNPLTLLERRKRATLSEFGQLQNVFERSDAAVPYVLHKQRMANLSGGRTARLAVSPGIHILKGIIQSLGGSPIGIEAAYKRANNVVLEFEDVSEDSIDINELDIFLNTCDPPKGDLGRRLIQAGDLFVIISTLSAKTLMVEAEFSNDESLEASAPALKGLASVDLGVDRSHGLKWKIALEGQVLMKFAFKASQIFPREGGSGLTLGHRAHGVLQAVPGSVAELRQYVSTDELVELNEGTDLG